MSGIQEYKSIRAIYPPKPGTIHKACTSCGGDVNMEKGFVEMDKPPFKGYLCASCTITTIGGNMAADLLTWAQETYRERSSR